MTYGGGVDMEIFQGHCRQTAALFRAKLDGRIINDILKRAGWVNNKFFEKLYT